MTGAKGESMTEVQRLGQEFDAAEEPWTPDERTVRACIEALPGLRVNGGCYGLSGYVHQEEVSSQYRQRAVSALEALLPKPDPAKELVEEWMQVSDWPDMGVEIAVQEYTRWLIDSGRVK